MTRLPGSRRAPAGVERVLLKRLPLIFLVGTLLPMILAGAALRLLNDATIFRYAMLGVVLTHWMAVMVAAILCLIIVLMKGHAYVADGYELPDSARPRL